MSNDTNSKEYEVEKILAHQILKNGEIKYLIKWKNCGINDTTWELEDNLVNCPDILNDYKSENNLIKNPNVSSQLKYWF